MAMNPRLLRPRAGGFSYQSLRQGLVAYWPLNETATSGDVTAKDESGNGYGLTSNNSVLSTAGKILNGRDFTAANSEFLSIASNSQLQYGNRDWTVSAWFNATTFVGQLVTKDLSGQREVELRTGTSGTSAVIAFLYHSGGAINLNINNLSAGVWYFTALRFVASTGVATLRVNSTTTTATIPLGQTANAGGTAQLQVGARQFVGARDFFTGVIDEVARWNRALSDAELDTLWNNGNGINLGRRA